MGLNSLIEVPEPVALVMVWAGGLGLVVWIVTALSYHRFGIVNPFAVIVGGRDPLSNAVDYLVRHDDGRIDPEQSEYQDPNWPKHRRAAEMILEQAAEGRIGVYAREVISVRPWRTRALARLPPDICGQIGLVADYFGGLPRKSVEAGPTEDAAMEVGFLEGTPDEIPMPPALTDIRVNMRDLVDLWE